MATSPECFPGRGNERRAPLSARTAAQLPERAATYRKMAETARGAGSADALVRLAERYEVMAEKRLAGPTRR